MKLASLKQGRDGRLVVVNRALTRCAPASGIADTLQQALDHWEISAPRLAALAARVVLADCARELVASKQWLGVKLI